MVLVVGLIALLRRQIIVVPTPIVVILNDVDIDHASLNIGPSLLLLQLGDNFHS